MMLAAGVRFLYEGSWSELFVPYMDATRNWSTRAFIDAGEFYPGGTLKSLRPGLDCPSNAAYLAGLSTDEKGAPVLRPRQACLFERFAGDVAWRHGDDPAMIFGRPARSLVLRSAAVVGNYDYLLDWRFEQNGSIRVAVGATGIIEARDVAEKGVDGMEHGAGSAEQYGQLVAKNTLGINHDHFFLYGPKKIEASKIPTSLPGTPWDSTMSRARKIGRSCPSCGTTL